MNREDIIRMAREAGDGDIWWYGDDALERFAALVADAAKLEMLMAGHDEWLEEARKAEREACAKVCDEMASRDKLSNYYAVAAKAIRARGNT